MLTRASAVSPMITQPELGIGITMSQVVCIGEARLHLNMILHIKSGNEMARLVMNIRLTSFIGGFPFYILNQVSVKPVPAMEQLGYGGQGEKINEFYRKAPIDKYNPLFGLFFNATSRSTQSFWIDRLGLVHFFTR